MEFASFRLCQSSPIYLWVLAVQAYSHSFLKRLKWKDNYSKTSLYRTRYIELHSISNFSNIYVKVSHISCLTYHTISRALFHISSFPAASDRVFMSSDDHFRGCIASLTDEQHAYRKHGDYVHTPCYVTQSLRDFVLCWLTGHYHGGNREGSILALSKGVARQLQGVHPCAK